MVDDTITNTKNWRKRKGKRSGPDTSIVRPQAIQTEILRYYVDIGPVSNDTGQKMLLAQPLWASDPLKSVADATVEEPGFDQVLEQTEDTWFYNHVSRKLIKVAMVTMVAMVMFMFPTN